MIPRKIGKLCAIDSAIVKMIYTYNKPLAFDFCDCGRVVKAADLSYLNN